MDEPSYIVVIPGVLDGRAHIAGRRITVHHIAMWHERMGMSPQHIASTFEIPLAAVRKALEHYRQHRPDIDDEIDSEVRWSREQYLDGYRQDPPEGAPPPEYVEPRHHQPPSGTGSARADASAGAAGD